MISKGNGIMKRKKRTVTSPAIDSDDESTESERSCTHDHKDLFGNFNEESDYRYFKEGGELFGTKCSDCKITFSDIEKEKCYVVRNKRPIYICSGRNKYECKHCLCMVCYNSRNVKRGARGKMTRVAAKT